MPDRDSDKRAPMTVTSFSQRMKDAFPQPGQRIKQYVVDRWREGEWERETCPRINVPEHLDNTKANCRNSNDWAWWSYLDHDCCSFCNDLMEATRDREDVKAWLTEKAKRPPVCADRDKYSDQVQEDWTMEPRPLLAMLPRGSVTMPDSDAIETTVRSWVSPICPRCGIEVPKGPAIACDGSLWHVECRAKSCAICGGEIDEDGGGCTECCEDPNCSECMRKIGDPDHA